MTVRSLGACCLLFLCFGLTLPFNGCLAPSKINCLELINWDLYIIWDHVGPLLVEFDTGVMGAAVCTPKNDTLC